MNRADGHAVTLLATGEHDCPYLDGRVARTAFVDPLARPTTQLYRQLIRLGFRRSGQYLYRPACPRCSECRSLRIPVRELRMRRRHRRCWRDNRDLLVRRVLPVCREEHFRLYRRYVNRRHAGGGMDNPSKESFASFLVAPWCRSLFYEFRDPDSGALLAVAVVDHLEDALSAVYTFYEPGLQSRSLGTYAILWQIAEAARQGIPHVYLGYWIRAAHRMAYKAGFLPHEIFDGQDWQRIDPR